MSTCRVQTPPVNTFVHSAIMYSNLHDLASCRAQMGDINKLLAIINILSYFFYRAMLFRYRDHIRFNTSKIISRLNSLRYLNLLTLTPTYGRYGSTGTPPKLGWNSLCLSEIIPCVLLTWLLLRKRVRGEVNREETRVCGESYMIQTSIIFD